MTAIFADASQITDEDTPLLGIPFFVVGASGGAACSALVTAAGDNTTLFPDGSATVSGTAPSCLLDLRPASNRSGIALVTLAAPPATRVIDVTVRPVNDAPTMGTIGAQSVVQGATVRVTFLASDVDGPLACTAAHLSYTSADTTKVAAAGAVTWGGTWPFCEGTVSTVTGSLGTVTVTFAVSDGAADATRSFVLTIQGPCILDGVTVPVGGSYLFYDTASADDCAARSQSRTCSGGALTGSPAYNVATCHSPRMVGAVGASVGCSAPDQRVWRWQCPGSSSWIYVYQYTYQFSGTGILACPPNATCEWQACGGNGWNVGTLACLP